MSGAGMNMACTRISSGEGALLLGTDKWAIRESLLVGGDCFLMMLGGGLVPSVL